MEGAKLAVDMLILHGVRSRIRNSVKVVKSANSEVQDVAFAGLCAALAVLTVPQKEAGAIVIDMGGGTTDYLVYAGRAIAHAGCLAVGGDHVTNDIALGMCLPMTQAEKLKLQYGDLANPVRVAEKNISLPAEGGFPGTVVKLGDLNTILRVRIEEVLTMIRDELVEQNLLSGVGAGVIITGGASRMKGMVDLVSEIFDLPCHIGIPQNISGLAIVTQGPEYAVPLGMVRYGFKTGQQAKPINPLFGVMKKLFGKSS